jgi:hypothetical protein
MEKLAGERGATLSELERTALGRLWEEAKADVGGADREIQLNA